MKIEGDCKRRRPVMVGGCCGVGGMRRQETEMGQLEGQKCEGPLRQSKDT